MILIASSSSARLQRWQDGLQGFAAVLVVHQWGSLIAALVHAAPPILLLDLELPGLDGAASIAGLRKAHPSTRIVALTGPLSDETELALFKSGVCGCCRIDIDTQLLKRVVVAVEQGELWIRRSLTPRLLHELGAKLPDESASGRRLDVARLAELTRREREIALLIGEGGSNKQIARQLAITERTVKAHLTGIFRKLGIGDRLRLALKVRAHPGVEGQDLS